MSVVAMNTNSAFAIAQEMADRASTGEFVALFCVAMRADGSATILNGGSNEKSTTFTMRGAIHWATLEYDRANFRTEDNK